MDPLFPAFLQPAAFFQRDWSFVQVEPNACHGACPLRWVPARIVISRNNNKLLQGPGQPREKLITIPNQGSAVPINKRIYQPADVFNMIVITDYNAPDTTYGYREPNAYHGAGSLRWVPARLGIPRNASRSDQILGVPGT